MKLKKMISHVASLLRKTSNSRSMEFLEIYIYIQYNIYIYAFFITYYVIYIYIYIMDHIYIYIINYVYIYINNTWCLCISYLLFDI